MTKKLTKLLNKLIHINNKSIKNYLKNNQLIKANDDIEYGSIIYEKLHRQNKKQYKVRLKLY